VKNVKEYLSELERSKEDRTEQVKEGLEMYVDLWKKAIERGVVGEGDKVDEALVKIDRAGGLYKAAGD
jgi:hypothetical protein